MADAFQALRIREIDLAGEQQHLHAAVRSVCTIARISGLHPAALKRPGRYLT